MQRRRFAIDAFNAGNYTRTLLEGSAEDWQWHAAWGLIGCTDRAISGLEQFSNPEALFYQAVALWIGGDEIKATRLLASLDLEHARRLLAFISKPRIKILAQLPEHTEGTHRIFSGGLLDPKFELVLLPGSTAHSENETAALLQSARPDFFICQMIEWHQVPHSVASFGCPTIGHTADYDLHIQGLIQPLQAFDELVVSDHDEHDGVAALSRAPVSVFPKVFACPDSLPAPLPRERDFDVFVSGTLFHPYHPDKARLMHHLLGLDDLRLVGFNGYLPRDQYYECLARSRLCVAYYRRNGGMVTRAIESVAMGCVTLVPNDSVLKLFVQQAEALVEYDPSGDDIARVTRSVLNDYGRHEQNAWKAAAAIRQELAPSVVASQYLRFCTVLAARPRKARALPAPARIDQRHLVILKGWLPAGGERKGMRTLAAANIRRWRRELSGQNSDRPVLINNILRERLLMYLHTLAWTEPSDWRTKPFNLDRASFPHRGKRDRLIESLRRASLLFPDRLVLRFNYLRAAIHLGADSELAKALPILTETLARPHGDWQVTTDDDVWPYDVFPVSFNYRRYFDALVEMLSQREKSNAPLIATILAALHHYRARVVGSQEDAQSATALDPTFPFFALEYAKLLAVSDNPDDRAKTASMLVELIDSSFVAREAWSVLKRLSDHENAKSLDTRVRQIQDNLIAADQYLFGDLNMLSLIQTPGRSGALGPQVLSSEPTTESKAFSILFVDQSSMNWRGLHKFLQAQSTARSNYELIIAETYDRVPDEVRNSCDRVIVCNQTDFAESKTAAANQGLMLVRSKTVVIVSGIPRTDAAALANLVADVEVDPTRAYVLRTKDGALLACSRDNILNWLGFDESPLCSGPESIVDALAERLRKGFVPVVRRAGAVPGESLSKSRRDLIEIVDGSKSGWQTRNPLLPYKPNPQLQAAALQGDINTPATPEGMASTSAWRAALRWPPADWAVRTWRLMRHGIPLGFDPAAYLRHNPAVAHARLDPVRHYVEHGRSQGLVWYPTLPRDFSVAAYLEHNPDVAAAKVDPTKHYLEFGWKERRRWK